MKANFTAPAPAGLQSDSDPNRLIPLRPGAIRTLAALIAITALYLPVTYTFAKNLPYWYDEFFTIHLTSLPTVGQLWAALSAGADSNPPAIYLLTKASRLAFGEGEAATRLPAIAGFLVFALSLCLFVSRRYGYLPGILAGLFPLITAAYSYSFEARPYGFGLGCFGLALVSWQGAESTRRRPLVLLALFAGVAGILLSHCYFVFAVLPLVAGELARAIRNRRVDRGVILAMAAAFPAVLTYLPLMGGSAELRQYSWSLPTWTKAITFFVEMLEPAVLPVFAVLALTAAALAVNRSRGVRNSPGLTVPEIVLVATLLVLPVIEVGFSKLFTGLYTHRYSLPAVGGCAILFAIPAASWGRLRGVFGALAIVLAGLWFADLTSFRVRTDRQAWSRANPAIEFARQVKALPELRDLPIVVTHGRLFVELMHHAPPELTSRIVYLSDEKSSLKYSGTNIYDMGFPIVQRWFAVPLNIQSYSSFVARHPAFLVYGPDSRQNGCNEWVLCRLAEDGAEIESKDYDGVRNFTMLVFITPRGHDLLQKTSYGSRRDE